MTFAGSMVLICWLAFMAAVFSSLFVHWQIVEAINRVRPQNEKVGLFDRFGVRSDLWRLSKIYRSYYPSGNLIRNYWLAQTAVFTSFGAWIASFYFAVR